MPGPVSLGSRQPARLHCPQVWCPPRAVCVCDAAPPPPAPCSAAVAQTMYQAYGRAVADQVSTTLPHSPFASAGQGPLPRRPEGVPHTAVSLQESTAHIWPLLQAPRIVSFCLLSASLKKAPPPKSCRLAVATPSRPPTPSPAPSPWLAAPDRPWLRCRSCRALFNPWVAPGPWLVSREMVPALGQVLRNYICMQLKQLS